MLFYARYTIVGKLEAVKRYLNGNESQMEIAKSIRVALPVFRTWIQQYHGEKSFEKRYTSYTLQYKKDGKYLYQFDLDSQISSNAQIELDNYSDIANIIIL